MGRDAKNGRVELRGTSMRIAFTWQGEVCRETVRIGDAPMPPTPANVKFARRLADQVQTEIRAGTFRYEKHFPHSPRAPKIKAQTLGELAALWLQSKGQLEDATRDQYRNAVTVWESLLGADTPVPDLTYQRLAAKIGSHAWTSPKAANNYLIVLRGIMGFEFNGARAALNPMAGIANLKAPKPVPDPLTTDERDAILKSLRETYDIRVWAYFAWMFFTGMRPEEAIALRWSSIDFRAEIARVERVRTFKGSERDSAKTEAGIRDVDLVQPALDALEAMKALTRLKTPDDQGDVFENPLTGRPWHDERSQRDTYWKPTLRRLGIRARRAYTTRHTYATAALMGGGNPAYVAAQMGHTDTQMFFGTYTKWINGADKGVQRAALAIALGTGIPRESPPPLPTNITPLSGSGRRDWIRTNRRKGE